MTQAINNKHYLTASQIRELRLMLHSALDKVDREPNDIETNFLIRLAADSNVGLTTNQLLLLLTAVMRIDRKTVVPSFIHGLIQQQPVKQAA